MKIKDLSTLLPEGITPETLDKISKVIQTAIDGEVASRFKILESKVFAFMRTNIESLKEQAIKELEVENDSLRKAAVLDEMKALMSLEIGSDDEDSAVSRSMKDNLELEEELKTVTEELNKVMLANEKLARSLELSKKENSSLESTKTKLEESVKETQERIKLLEEEKAPSGDALILSRGNDVVTGDKKEKSGVSDNPFLTEEVLHLAAPKKTLKAQGA